MDLQRRKNLILKGNIYKVLVTLAIPIMANNIIQCLYNMADGFWVSMIGSVEFAATSFVWPVDFLFISIGSGISIAGTALLSRLIGANKAKEGKKYSAQLFAISLLTSVIFTIIGLLLSYYLGLKPGGTIVLIGVFFLIISLIIKRDNN